MNNNFKLQVIIFLIIFLNNRQKLMCNFIILIKKRFLFYKLFNLLVIINHFFLFLNMDYRSGCPMCNALDIVGDKWSLIVIRDLLGGKTTFKEFMNGPEKIASNILSQRLKWLKNHEILDFRYRKDNKKEKCYYLTNKGIDLYPVMSELMLWSAKNVNNEFNDRGKDVIKKLKNDKQARIEEVTQNYKKIKSKLQIS